MGSELGSLLILLLPLLFIGYIFLTQRRRVRQITAMQSGLTVGDEVRTTSGLYGRVTALTDSDMSLQVAQGVVVRFDRRAVDLVLPSGADAAGSSPSDTR